GPRGVGLVGLVEARERATERVELLGGAPALHLAGRLEGVDGSGPPARLVERLRFEVEALGAREAGLVTIDELDRRGRLGPLDEHLDRAPVLPRAQLDLASLDLAARSL